MSKHDIDPQESRAVDALRDFFSQNTENVFYSRQLDVIFENRFFHWVTHRAVKDLLAEGFIKSERSLLSHGSEIVLYWNAKYRYPKRKIGEIKGIVDQFSAHDVSRSNGDNAEALVLDGFARNQFLMLGRETNAYKGVVWNDTEHDLDFIFARDGRVYGIEVKNRLQYMNRDLFEIKIEMCKHLDIVPVFVVRMFPNSWIQDLNKVGGFALILKYQLFSPLLKDLAALMRDRLNLPTGTPSRLEEGTMKRFLEWHGRHL